MKFAELRSRWAPERAADAFARLTTGRDLAPVAFGEVDGRLDLRGLPGDLDAFRSGRSDAYPPLDYVDVRDTTWEHLDLTAAALPALWLSRCTIVGSIFARADLTSWTTAGCTVRSCSFEHAVLYACSLGAETRSLLRRKRRPGLFEDCDFTGADVRRGYPGTTTTYCRCTFERFRSTDSWWLDAAPDVAERRDWQAWTAQR
ncbi:MAG TPA: hypothetical protein VM938_06010 [Acidimicrobiales bacterium]|nr:hypothetical protein [Acidimicrobiales bacterium]